MKKVPAEWTKKAPSKKMANSSNYPTSDVIQINERRKRFASN